MGDPKKLLAETGAGKTTLKFQRNQVIFAQGDAAGAVFFIQRGRVKVTVLSERGKEAVVAILLPGQFFGEACLQGHPWYGATATAMEDSVITCIDKTAMLALMSEQPAVLKFFMNYLLARNSRLEEDLIDQMFNSTEKRLARLLLLLADFGGETCPQPTAPPISQETLAEMIGTTRSRVSVFMNKFRKLGLVRYRYNGAIEADGELLRSFLLAAPGPDRRRSERGMSEA
jgi:CRP-like cAMP-binding protein